MTKEEILAQVSLAIDQGRDVAVLNGEIVEEAPEGNRFFILNEKYEHHVLFMKGAARHYEWQPTILNEEYNGVDEDIPKTLPNPETIQLHARKRIRNYCLGYVNSQVTHEATEAALEDVIIEEVK